MTVAEPRIVTRAYCTCSRRMAAQAEGDFLFLPHAGAWVFTDGEPRREMSPRARYYAFCERTEYKHEDHTGEPVLFQCCPWCGKDLPQVILDIVREADGLSDPEP